MANAAARFISKVLQDQDLSTPIRLGIAPTMILSPVEREMYAAILEHYRSREHYGRVPSLRWMRERFSGYRDLKVAESMEEVCAELREEVMRTRIDQLVLDVGDLNRDSPFKAMELMRSGFLDIQRLTPSSCTDLILADDAERLIEDYELRANPDAMMGLPWPWQEVNDEIGGIQNEDLVVIFGRPKCIVEGQRILSADGRLQPIQVPTDRTAQLLDGQRLGWGACSSSYAGTRRALRVTTRSGHVIEVGEDHPMLTPDLSFVPANRLDPGHYVGVARRLPEPETPVNMTEGAARLLGLLTGNGNYTRNEVQFTAQDADVAESLRACVSDFGAHLTTNPKKPTQYRIVGNGKRGSGSNPVLCWLRRLGCVGHKAPTKRVPDEVFMCNNHIVAEFLSGYTDTDGTVTNRVVAWSTASYGLALDIKHLLLRFGITAILRHVTTNYKEGTDAWHLTVNAQEQHRVLHRVLKLSHQKKADRLRKLATVNIRRKRHDDGIPHSDRLMSTILAARGDQGWKGMWSAGFSTGKLFRRTGRISRHLLRRLARCLNAPQLLEWSDSDIRWEPITSIVDLGPCRCWDLTMEDAEHPTFVAEGFITHNSMKSWLAAEIGTSAYELANARVLIYGCEMRNLRFMRRVAACHLHLDYEKLKRGRLPANAVRWYKARLRELRESEIADSRGGRHRSIKFVAAFDDPQGGGVAHLTAKAEEFDPDLIIIDSYYRMKDDRSGKRSIRWDHQTSLTQDVKGITQTLHRPVIAVTQRTRRKGGETDAEDEHVEDVAFADAVGQEADTVIRVKKDGKLPTGDIQLRINWAAARETEVAGFLLHVRLSERWKFYDWLREDEKLIADSGPEKGVQQTGVRPSMRKGGIPRRAVKATKAVEAIIDRSYFDLGVDVEDL